MLSFFQHMDITNRVNAGEATQSDANALLAEVNALRLKRGQLYGQLMRAYGLTKTTAAASLEALEILNKEAEQMSLMLRIETSTD